MLSPEDELEVLEDDLRLARRRLGSLERAPFESRVADVWEYERSVHFARQRVRDLEHERAGAIADLIALAEGHVA